MIPNDPIILLGYINTKLRDCYSSIELLCDDLEIEEKNLIKKLEGIDYHYDRKRNQFI